MDANQATAELLEAGKSGELSAAFQCVAEATTLQAKRLPLGRLPYYIILIYIYIYILLLYYIL